MLKRKAITEFNAALADTLKQSWGRIMALLDTVN